MTCTRPLSFRLSLVFSMLLCGLSAIAQTPAQYSADASQPASKPAGKPATKDAGAGVPKEAPLRRIGGVALSPDGSRVAWVMRGKNGTRIEVLPLSGMGSQQTLSAADDPNKDCDTSEPVWSPDSKQLAMLSDCAAAEAPAAAGSSTTTTPAASAAPSQSQIFVMSADNGSARQLGMLKGALSDVTWSPDGKQIGFLYVENATRASGAVAAQRVPVGVIDEQQVSEVQRLAVIDPRAGTLKLVTPAKLHIYEFCWAHDGASVTYTAASPPGENNWWVAKLYTQQIGLSGVTTQPQVVLDPASVHGSLHGLQIAVPRFSPDGRQIAFIGGLMSDFGSTGGDIYMVSAVGGSEPRNLTANRKSTPVWIHWQDAKTIGFTELDAGNAKFATMNLVDGSTKEYFSAPESIGDGRAAMSLSFSDDGKVAFTRSGWDRAPEVWAGSFDHLQQVTHLNGSAKPVGGKVESLEWTSEGSKVQGWLMYPAGYDSHKKYPMLVSVHGGPAAAETAHWPGRGFDVHFSGIGYFMFMPNPRGSFGQGEAFVQANRKDFGYGDLRDILAGVDAIEKKVSVDDKRIGIVGGSYGGFMAMFAPTQTHRFSASVAIAGISDWLSYYGENSIDQWMIPYFGASVYDDPAPYARVSSINFIKQDKTPTLIIVGDRDGECPPPQSFEQWHAMKALGVATELVIYPNEGHGLSNPEHATDALKKAVDWFAKYMPE